MLDDPLVKPFLTNVVEDESNLPIIECLIDGVETDEEIAEKTGIRLNLVRKILYKLYDLKLASYKRSKDPETQWFTYSWKFEKDEVVKHIREACEADVKHFEEALNEEENNMYFICPQGHVRFDFNTASEYEFICPECGEEMEFFDNEEQINQLKDIIENIKLNLDNFNEKH